MVFICVQNLVGIGAVVSIILTETVTVKRISCKLSVMLCLIG